MSTASFVFGFAIGAAFIGIGFIAGRYHGITVGLRRESAALRSAVDKAFDRSFEGGYTPDEQQSPYDPRSNPHYDHITGPDRDRNG